MKLKKIEKTMAIVALVVIALLLIGMLVAAFSANQGLFLGFAVCTLLFSIIVHIFIQKVKREKEKHELEGVNNER